MIIRGLFVFRAVAFLGDEKGPRRIFIKSCEKNLQNPDPLENVHGLDRLAACQLKRHRSRKFTVGHMGDFSEPAYGLL
jgi:hypothetical protein